MAGAAGERRPETARLFAGLRPAPADAARLSGWAAGALLPLDERVRLVDEAALHVTLVFLGAVPADRVPEALAATVALGAGGRVGTLEPTGVRAYGSALALVLRPTAAGAWIPDVQAQLADRLMAAGLARREARAWSPHLTLARVPSRRRVRMPLPTAPADPVRVEGVSLFRSVPGPRGAFYHRLDAAGVERDDAAGR